VPRIELAGGGLLDLRERWLSAADEGRMFAALRDQVGWEHKEIEIAGRTFLQPRLTAWYGDPGARYSYSGITLEPVPWHPVLAEIRARIESDTGHRLNSVLCNLYRDGDDAMGWHSDREKELGPNPVIASVSLGAARRFVLKHRKKAAPNVVIELEGGSLLLMTGSTQHEWRHTLPRTRTPVGARINLTYRRIVGTSD
jgi:alkylated DNA repair dioxygenase AlkB